MKCPMCKTCVIQALRMCVHALCLQFCTRVKVSRVSGSLRVSGAVSCLLCPPEMLYLKWEKESLQMGKMSTVVKLGCLKPALRFIPDYGVAFAPLLGYSLIHVNNNGKDWCFVLGFAVCCFVWFWVPGIELRTLQLPSKHRYCATQLYPWYFVFWRQGLAV